MLGQWMQTRPVGVQLFRGITAATALGTLREILGEQNVAAAHDYRTHDLRRGHAKDMQLNGKRYSTTT